MPHTANKDSKAPWSSANVTTSQGEVQQQPQSLHTVSLKDSIKALNITKQVVIGTVVIILILFVSAMGVRMLVLRYLARRKTSKDVKGAKDAKVEDAHASKDDHTSDDKRVKHRHRHTKNGDDTKEKHRHRHHHKDAKDAREKRRHHRHHRHE